MMDENNRDFWVTKENKFVRKIRPNHCNSHVCFQNIGTKYTQFPYFFRKCIWECWWTKSLGFRKLKKNLIFSNIFQCRSPERGVRQEIITLHLLLKNFSKLPLWSFVGLCSHLIGVTQAIKQPGALYALHKIFFIFLLS